MTQKQQNPLSSYYRAPKLYSKLPSQGKYYTSDVVELPENGELPVFGMTAKDEMLMKNPDALLNGEAVVRVIESCVPNIKNAKEMLSSDVDTLLVAIQGATHGDDIEVKATCDKCESEATGIASVETALGTMGILEDEYVVDINNLSITVRPFTYNSTIKAGLTNFKSTRSLQALGEIDDDQERLKIFNENFQQVAALNFDLILDSIASIAGSNDNDEDFEVVDREFISEYLNNVDSSVGKAIEDKIADINSIGIQQEMMMTCVNPECPENEGKNIDEDEDLHTFNAKVNFDPVNFFTAS